MMPAKRTPRKSYRCICGFMFPTSRSIRDRIRAGEHMPVKERGEWQRYAVGDKIVNPPSDLIENWLRRGLVELVSKAAKKSEAALR